MLSGREDWLRSFKSFSCDTISNALLRSICTKRVRCAGFFSLKPPATASVNSCRADTVECWDLNPCCISGIGRFLVRVGRRALSRILIPGQSRDTGRLEVDSSAGFPGLRGGLIVEVFQIAGMVLVFKEMLKMSVKYCIPYSPRCFK